MLYRYVEQLLNVYNYIDAMLVTDERGVIRFYKCFRPDVNPTTPKDVLGRHILEVYPELDENTSTVMRVLRTGEPILNEYQEFFFKGLGINSVNTTLPVRDRDRLVGVLCAARYLDPPFQRRGVTLDLKEPSREEALYTVDDIVSLSPAMDLVKERIHMIADTGSSVLLYGETGTGKELVAQSIHSGSARRGKRFVSQNCAAIPGTLLESILFGTVKGSYTGAENRPGLFELADGGTLFLDEINSMEISVQAKLLKAIEEKQVTRIGALEPTKVDVKIVSATNENPLQCVEAHRLREDLFYRLSVVQLNIPPLRERLEDLPCLISHFIATFNRRMNRAVVGIDDEVEEIFHRYGWPGNVRELKNVIEGAFNLTASRFLQKNCLPEYLLGRVERGAPAAAAWPLSGDFPLDAAVRAYEKGLIQRALASSRSLAEAADKLGISRQSLNYKLGKFRLEH